MNTELRGNIDWVGYVDWNVRDFHGYDTDRGSTYNAYLVRDETTALIDTVKARYWQDLVSRISALTNPSNISYIVCNHAEPDHAGSMPRIMEAAPNATLVCNERCWHALSLHHDVSKWRKRIVTTGDTISLGRRTLRFIDTPMLHWPESMFTYVPEDSLLFSMDAFGQHYATSSRFDDEEVILSHVMDEAKTYYANILMPYSKQVKSLLKDMAELEIGMIAPSHGVIWRNHVNEILEAYRNWGERRLKPKVLIVYDTMWESTAKMARAILEGASLPGIEVQLIHIRHSNLTCIATEVLDTAVMAFGSSTLNSGMMPMAGAVLTYLKGLRPTGMAGMAFGSFGWGKGGSEAIDEWLRGMKIEVLREPLKAKYRPSAETLEECRETGRMLAEKAKEMAVRPQIRPVSSIYD